MEVERQMTTLCDKMPDMDKILQPCGTYAAARRHQRHNEKMCRLCLDVIAKRQREFYHRRKAAITECA